MFSAARVCAVEAEEDAAAGLSVRALFATLALAPTGADAPARFVFFGISADAAVCLV